jgi:hypothetical protein
MQVGLQLKDKCFEICANPDFSLSKLQVGLQLKEKHPEIRNFSFVQLQVGSQLTLVA